MNWSVTYRAKDGRQTVDVFEAESREALFKALADKKISAISVQESLTRPTRQSKANRPCLFLRVAVWACVGLFVAVGAFFVATRLGNGNDAERRPASPGNDKHIAEVLSKVAPATPVARPEPKKSARRTTAKGTPIPDNVQPDERGVLRYPGGLRWVDTNDLHIVKHPRKKQLFKHHSENSIATILTLEPEKMAPFLVGRRPKFGQRFVDDFKASLYDEPEYPEDDTPEERAVRNEVLAVKKEMADALKRGEDIAKMMNDAQDELDRLVTYRDSLMKQLKDIRNDGKYSDNDVSDFVAAANQMLKSQGLKELATPNLTYRQFVLQRRRERQESQQSQSERK